MSKPKDVYRTEFLNKTCRVLDDYLGPRTCTVGTVIGSSLPIAMIVMGAIHLDNCPAERYIPIYLIVSGCFSIALAVFMVIGTWMQDKNWKIPKALSIPSVVMGLFLFAWLIAGTCTVGTVIGSSLPIAMIVMGAIHLDNCPAERYIPIYLIVSGCFSIALAVFMVIGTWMQDKDGKIPKALSIPSVVMGLFLFAGFIAGSVWIYRIYNKYDPDNVLAPNYCDNTFYLFAFWVTTVVYILISLIVCCFTIYLCVLGIIAWMCIMSK